MRKTTPVRSVMLISAVLLFAMLLSACAEQATRLPATHVYSPGAVFSTNINDTDVRRVLRCAIIFEVIDEAATEELVEFNHAIRNAVLVVLSGLTVEELTTNKDLNAIAEMLVEQVNEVIPSHVNLVVGAYFTDIVLS